MFVTLSFFFLLSDSDCIYIQEEEEAERAPPGVDADTYQKVLQLREQKLDEEDRLSEFYASMQALKREHDDFVKRDAAIDASLQDTEVKIQKFQTQKQKKLNELFITVCAIRNLFFVCILNECLFVNRSLSKLTNFKTCLVGNSLVRTSLSPLCSRVMLCKPCINAFVISHELLCFIRPLFFFAQPSLTNACEIRKSQIC